MKRSKLVVLLMLLTLAFSWFVSVGVVFAENPWDADGPGQAGSSDTSSSPTTNIRPIGDILLHPDGLDVFRGWLLQVYFRVHVQKPAVAAPAIVGGGEKGQMTNTSRR